VDGVRDPSIIELDLRNLLLLAADIIERVGLRAALPAIEPAAYRHGTVGFVEDACDARARQGAGNGKPGFVDPAFDDAACPRQAKERTIVSHAMGWRCRST